ncbi:MAG: sigma 54-interacting transcriptional regulator [Acidobacteriota bacterium]|jgi:PAS domain S-box-containing protein
MLNQLIENPNVVRLLNLIDDGVLVISAERRVVYINDTAKSILKYDEGEVINSRCRHIARTTECETNCPLTRAIDADEDQTNVDMWYRTKDGQEVYCRTNICLIRGDKGEVVGGVEIFKNINRIIPVEGSIEERFSFGGIIGRNPAMQEVFDLIRMVADTDSMVLITGESGTGKELVANAIHYNSFRRNKPFVKVNCAALNEGVLESELFGHVKGAFTGAISDKIGRFEMATGGTLFLDEIGEIPMTTQVKLLRVLQEGELERVGSSRTIRVDVRVIAATNKNLEDAISKGEFRQDLYYRLNVFHIPLPPLRERREDIPLLVDHFIKKVATKMPFKEVEGIEAEALSRLMNYDFPGNIRELENLIEHAAIRCQNGVIRAHDLPLPTRAFANDSQVTLHQIRTPLENLERDLIVKTLESCGWRINKTAQRLGVSRVTLWRKMKEYAVQKPNQD